MNKTTTGKIVVSFLAVAVAFAVSAGEATWTGASTEGPGWSDTANWSDTTPPTSADKATFPLAEQTVRLDGDYAVTDFSVAADASALFYNDDTTRTNTLTITELDTIGETDAQIKLSGPVQVNIGDAGNRINKASIIVSNGAAFVATQLDNSVGGGQKLIATGANSKIEIGSLVLGTTSKKNPNQSLEAYDGGSITVKSFPNTQPKSAYTVIATNGSSIVATDLAFALDTSDHKVTCEDSYLAIAQFSGYGKNVLLKVGGTGFLSCGNLSIAVVAQKYYQDLWLCGKDPRIEVTNPKPVSFGNASCPGYGSLNLEPEPTWKESVARITHTATKSLDCKIAVNSGLNFKIDCSGFANYYGKRSMRLFEQKYSSRWISSFVTPTGDYLIKSGEGAECCEVSFSTNIEKRAYFMTMVSTNAVPPANAVAGVNNIGKDTLFFPTLAEAIQTAAAADDEEVDIVLPRRATIDVLENPGSKPIKIYALRPVTLSTVSGEAGAGIVVGENVTLRKKQGLVLFVQ